MNDVWLLYVSLSLSGSVVAVLLLLLRPLIKRRLSKAWQYYIYLIVVARFLLPFGPESGLMEALFRPAQEAPAYAGYSAVADDPAFLAAGPVWQEPGERADRGGGAERGRRPPWLWLLWLAPAAALFLHKVVVSYRFIRSIRVSCMPVEEGELWRSYRKICCAMGIDDPPRLVRDSQVAAPMLVGIFHPSIVLPDAEIPGDHLYFILLHELIHHRRQDILYKWLVQLTLCLHWYNPLIYLVSREINRNCELSCDEAVVGHLDRADRLTYGETLLDSISFDGVAARSSFVEERLAAVMEHRKRPKSALALAAALTAFLALATAATGIYTADGPGVISAAQTIPLGTEQSVRICEIPLGGAAYPQSYFLDVSQSGKRIIIGVSATGSGVSTIELVSPGGVTAGRYSVNEHGVVESDGSEWTVIGGRLVVATDVAEPGIWRLNISSGSGKNGGLSLSGRLIDPGVPAPESPGEAQAPPQ